MDRPWHSLSERPLFMRPGDCLPTRGDILAMLEGAADAVSSGTGRDMTVEEVAEEVQRSPSTIRRWLIAGELRGYKLQGRDWRVPRPALRDYLAAQVASGNEEAPVNSEVDIAAWRRCAGRALRRSNRAALKWPPQTPQTSPLPRPVR